jgi:hypothetical protein
MKLNSKLSIVSALCILALLSGALSANLAPVPHRLMENTAIKFLNLLNEQQRKQCAFPFSHPERRKWAYLPGNRVGLPVGELNQKQRTQFTSLLQAGLSSAGYFKAEGVLILEAVLKELQPNAGRDPGKYVLSFFGNPGQGNWGWSFEGHHLSVNFTADSKGGRASTPLFYGVAPATVAEGPHQGFRVLGAEVDLARILFHSFNMEQQGNAKLAGSRPADVALGPNRKHALKSEGISLKNMQVEQRLAFFDLVSEYTGNLPPAQARVELLRLQKFDAKDLFFAWLGDWNGGPLYYRITGPNFAMEYASVGNDPNHAHSVWRDLKQDFGQSLIAHHASDPGKADE